MEWGSKSKGLSLVRDDGEIFVHVYRGKRQINEMASGGVLFHSCIELFFVYVLDIGLVLRNIS